MRGSLGGVFRFSLMTATMDPEIVVWAAAQPVGVIGPTPMEWFEYTVTDGEPPVVPPEGGGTQSPAGQQADEPDPAAPPAEATITPAKGAKK